MEEDRLWVCETLDANVDKIPDSSTKPSSESPVKIRARLDVVSDSPNF